MDRIKAAFLQGAAKQAPLNVYPEDQAKHGRPDKNQSKPRKRLDTSENLAVWTMIG